MRSATASLHSSFRPSAKQATRRSAWLNSWPRERALWLSLSSKPKPGSVRCLRTTERISILPCENRTVLVVRESQMGRCRE
jgi:hypothetical protein